MAIGNATRAKLERVEQVGGLQTDAGTLAGGVMQSLHDGTKVVWVDDDARVFAAPANEAGNLPAHWIVGVFHAAQPVDEVVGTLRAAGLMRPDANGP